MEWISVKDRLPEGAYTVIVHCGRGYGLAKYTHCTSNWHIQPFFDEWYKSDDCVTHWMPLPEPPERDTIRININVQGDAVELTLAEFEDRVCRIVKRAMM